MIQYKKVILLLILTMDSNRWIKRTLDLFWKGSYNVSIFPKNYKNKW